MEFIIGFSKAILIMLATFMYCYCLSKFEKHTRMKSLIDFLKKLQVKRITTKTLTPQQIVDLKPCLDYNPERIIELFDNKKSLTYLEILDTDKIPLEDIIWVFCQLTVLNSKIKKQWLEVIVTRAVTNYALNCGIDDVEKWAENWLSGNDRTYSSAAHTAYASDYTTRYTAHAAALYAARTAVCFADAAYTTTAYIAAHAAYANDAANDADYATLKIERKQQIQDLKDILQGEK
jgi:hypothetical protein